MFSSDPTLAVVPIVVNAGAALLPAILAALTTFVSLLFKPKELIRACQRRPLVPVAILAGGVAIWAAVAFWPSQNSPWRRAPVVATATQVDWTRVALERIEAGKLAPASASPAPESTSSEPFIFRGGPLRTGTIGAAPGAGLRLAWKYYPRWTDESGVEQEDTESMILSSPAVHGNRVFGASCLIDPPDTFGAIFALDAATGKQLWTVDRADDVELKGFFGSPAVTADGRFVIVGEGLHPDSQCRLICVDTQSGRVAWTRQVPLHLESSPAIEGDMVYVGAGAIEDPSTHKPISHPGFVMAVRISDGAELWRYDVADPESSPIVKDGVLYIGSGFNGQAVVALDVSGDQPKLLWKTAAPYPITGAVTLVGDTVIAGGGNGDFVYRDPKPAGVVLGLNRQTGEILWKTEMPDAVLGAVAAGKFLICPVANGEVAALDPKTGSRLWGTAVNGRSPVLAAAAVSETEVFAVSQDGYLARLNLADGKLLEKVYLNSEQKPGAQGLSISSPLIANGRVLVGSETGGLRSYTGGNP